MQLDYRQFLSKLAKITPFNPQIEFVDAFIKAWYLTEQEFEMFLLTAPKKGYSHQQLSNLVVVWPGTKDKKVRAHLGKIVDELYGE